MIVYYSHGGSGNHGCEALVRSTRKILKRFDQKGQESVLYTYKITDDVKYIPDGIFSQIIDLIVFSGDFRFKSIALCGNKAYYISSVEAVNCTSEFDIGHIITNLSTIFYIVTYFSPFVNTFLRGVHFDAFA